MLEDRAQRNKLRSIVDRAEKNKIVTREEVGFIVTLVERYRVDIEKKTKQLFVLQGEIAQLRANEQIIMNLVESMIKAAERDKARQDTHERIREMQNEKSEEKEEVEQEE
jgi:hypothetical protein